MTLDPRTPVLVGVAQISARSEDPLAAPEPLDSLTEVLRLAGDDAGAPSLLGAADSIRIAKGVWDYSNPAAILATRFGAESPECGLSPVSGNMIQFLVSDAAREIAAGKREVVLIAGAEAEHSKRRARRQGHEVERTIQTDSAPDVTFSSDTPFLIREELEAGLRQPATIFSLFENGLRAERGEALDAHRRRVSELWSGLNAVAVDNPHAWIRERMTPEQIRSATPENPMIAYPYTKFMVANMVVDQAAALILCSAEAAERHGVPRDRWIFPHAGTDADKLPVLSHRDDLHSAPAIGIAGRKALELAGVAIDDIAHIDLYSCFPIAVQLAMDELGIDASRSVTVTGGLGFAGGPFNSYVLHSIATMVTRLREAPTDFGLVTGLGGWLSKHSIGVYSAKPPADGFRHANVNADVARLPTRDLATRVGGSAIVETYAVQHVHGAPVGLVASCWLADGRRAWATSEDPELVADVMQNEFCGRAVRIDGEDRLRVER